jgi:hypothetical protein
MDFCGRDELEIKTTKNMVLIPRGFKITCPIKFGRVYRTSCTTYSLMVNSEFK